MTSFDSSPSTARLRNLRRPSGANIDHITCARRPYTKQHQRCDRLSVCSIPTLTWHRNSNPNPKCTFAAPFQSFQLHPSSVTRPWQHQSKTFFLRHFNCVFTVPISQILILSWESQSQTFSLRHFNYIFTAPASDICHRHFKLYLNTVSHSASIRYLSHTF